MSKKSVVMAGATVLTGMMIAGSAVALDQKPVLSLDLAKSIADGCEAFLAQQTDWPPLNIAVVDDGGNLKLFRRMDGSFLVSVEISQMKAKSSAAVPFPTRAIGEIAYGKDGNPGRVPGLAEVPGLAAFAGGLPIMTSDGHHIGGVGVSGATSDQDEQCAQAALDSVKDQL